MIAWIKNWVKNQIETNPVIVPFFDESKGWRWFWRLYFLVGFFILFEMVLLWFGISGLLFSPMSEEQDPQKKIDTFREWVLVVTVFFYLFGTIIYIGRVFSFTRKLTLEKKIVPKINFLKYYPPRNNFFTNYVGILLFFYLMFFTPFFSKVHEFISFIFGDVGEYGRILVVIAILLGGTFLAGKAILWIDKQKPVLIHTSFGMVVLLYFLSFVWLINYS